MTDGEEAAFELGRRAAYATQLREAVAILRPKDEPLAYEDPLTQSQWREARLVSERADLILVLRTWCEELPEGANDWDNDLNLIDVLENYIRPALRGD